MATDIVMPNLGFDAQEGRLVEWLKQPGDEVKRGEVIAVIESDKANVELESIAAGVLLEQLCAAGDTVSVGAVIARVGAASEPVTSATAPQPAAASSSPAAMPPSVSPVARRLAEDSGVDLSQVRGSGPGGKIMREDVEAAMKPAARDGGGHKSGNGILALPKVRKAARDAGINLADVPASGARGQVTLADLDAYQRGAAAAVVAPAVAAAAPPREGVREIELSRMRQLIGKRLGDSKREAPHFYVTGEFDLEAALGVLNSLPQPAPRLNDLIQYLTVQTLLRVPELNATYEDGRLYQHNSIDLAIAVARDDGLITPVLPGAERYSLQGMSSEGRALIKRARENRLQPADLQNGTFTISNLGVMKQVDHFTAVINPPQVAILAVGTVKQRPLVVDGGLFIRHTVHLTLSGDHRVVDGMHLGRFMAAFQEQLDAFSRG